MLFPLEKTTFILLPCDIAFWGKPENEQEVIQRMRQHGYILKTCREPIPQRGGVPRLDLHSWIGTGRPPSMRISQDQVTNILINF